MREGLLYCGNCGSTAKLYESDGMLTVQCKECPLHTAQFDDRRAAVVEWNTLFGDCVNVYLVANEDDNRFAVMQHLMDEAGIEYAVVEPEEGDTMVGVLLEEATAPYLLEEEETPYTYDEFLECVDWRTAEVERAG